MTQDVTIQRSDVSRFDDPALIKVITETVARGATPSQLSMFLQVCKRTGLDPFLKEIWYVAEKGIIMAGRDGYLRVANENPQFDGIEKQASRSRQSAQYGAKIAATRRSAKRTTASIKVLRRSGRNIHRR